MKNLSSKWLLAFTMLAAVSFISCGSDDDEVTPPEVEMEVEADDTSKPSTLSTGSSTTYISYNDDGLVSQIKTEDGGFVQSLRYDYSQLESNHKIIVKRYTRRNGGEEYESESWHEFDLEDGRVVASRIVNGEDQTSSEGTYTYNEKGQLISYKPQGGNEYRITWENYVITDVETKYGDEEEWMSRIATLEYSKVKVGKYCGYFDLTMKDAVLVYEEEMGLLLNSMFGTKVKYFPSKMTIDDHGMGIECTLKFNSKTDAVPSSTTGMGITHQITWMKAIKAKVKVK